QSAHLHVGQGPQRREQGHGLSRARRPAEHERAVLGQPGVQEGFVAHRVHRRHHHVRCCHLVRLHLHLRHLALPRGPLSRRGGYLIVDDGQPGVCRHGHGGHAADEVSQLRAHLETPVASKRPEQGVHQALGDVLLQLVVLQPNTHTPFRVCVVVGEDVVSGLVEHGEERPQRPEAGEVHHMLLAGRPVQATHHQSIAAEVWLEDQGHVPLHLGAPKHRREASVHLSSFLLAVGVLLLLGLLQGDVPQLEQEVLKHHLRAQHVLAEPDHAAARHRRQCRKAQVLHLKHHPHLRKQGQSHVGGQAEALPVGQGEQLVVVQDAVEVLHPLRVHVPIKDDPLPLVDLPTHIVNDPTHTQTPRSHSLSEDVSEESVCPFTRVGVQDSQNGALGTHLGVNDVGDSLDALQALQGLEQHLPGGRLAASARADHHQAVVQLRDLCQQCPHLLHPGASLLLPLARHQVHLLAHLDNVLLEAAHLGPGVRHPREDVREQREEQRDVLRHQLGHHRLAHALDQNLGGRHSQ
ncbi:unnamed protein product, partial [Ixodes pacificus]